MNDQIFINLLLGIGLGAVALMALMVWRIMTRSPSVRYEESNYD